MLNNPEFLDKVRKKEYHYFNDFEYDLSLNRFNWDKFIKYLDNHPEDLLSWGTDIKKRVILTGIEKRNSSEVFIKQIIEELKNVFSENIITAHFFVTFAKTGKSFDIHRDAMDVLYLQTLGKIKWSVWSPPDDKEYRDRLTIEEAKKMGFKKTFEKDFTSGDMIWIPRGTYHYVEPYNSRVGVSFGVEGKTNPATYV